MCILYKYIYITSITFLVLFELVSANIKTDFVDTQNPILPCLLHYTYHILSCSLLLNSDLFHALCCFMLSMMLGNYLTMNFI